MSLEMIVAIVIIECIVRPEECHLGLMIVVFNLTKLSSVSEFFPGLTIFVWCFAADLASDDDDAAVNWHPISFRVMD